MTDETPLTRVMLVDDHEVVRGGVRALLESSGEFDIVAEAGTVADAILRARSYKPDVVVMDVRLPDGGGVEACREIRSKHPDIAVLMLTSYSDDEALFDSIMAGASGFVLKQIRGTDLVGALRRVANGESLLDPAVTGKVLARLRDPHHGEDPLLAKLTPTERRILEGIAEGLTNRQIGDSLHLAEKTIKNYVSSILSKMHMSRRAEAAAYLAAQRGRD